MLCAHHWSVSGSITVGVLLCVACVQRDNPWDPVNYRPPPATLDCTNPDIATPVRDSLSEVVHSLFGSACTKAPCIDTALASLAYDSALNATRTRFNDSVRILNDTRVSHNAYVMAANDTISTPSNLLFMELLDPVLLLVSPDTTPALKDLIADLTIGRLRADSALVHANARCAQGEIVSPAVAAVWLQPFDSVLARTLGILSMLREATAYATRQNVQTLGPYNVWVTAYNDTVRSYNDSIRFIQRAQAHGQITSTTFLEQCVFASTPGDTLLVAGGMYAPVIRFANNGTPDSPIVILGQPSPATVFSDADVILSGTRYVVFVNIVFRHAGGSGVKLEAGAGPVTFHRCVFDSNAAHGLEVIDSDVWLSDCRIMHNGACGMRVTSAATPSTVTLVNTLVARNVADGIEALSTVLRLQNVTIDGNGEGILLKNPERELYLLSSLITYNRRNGVHYEAGSVRIAPVLSAAVFWGNGQEPLVGTFEQPPNYLSLSTTYVNASAGDYTIAPGCGLDSLQRSVPGLIIGYRQR